VNARTLIALGLVFFSFAACTSGSEDTTEAESSPGTEATQGSQSEDGSQDDPDTDPDEGIPAGSPEESSTTLAEKEKDATSSGDVGGYPELTRAVLQGSAEGVTFDLGFAKTVPEKTPVRVQMTVALSIIDSEGGRYLLNALGTEEGWSAYVVTAEGRADFGGAFDISGRKIRLAIPWTDLGGPRPFNWIVSSSWTGDPKKGTSYAFDSIPNSGFAGFPETQDSEKSP
jgi:hypothetical protein